MLLTTSSRRSLTGVTLTNCFCKWYTFEKTTFLVYWFVNNNNLLWFSFQICWFLYLPTIYAYIQTHTYLLMLKNLWILFFLSDIFFITWNAVLYLYLNRRPVHFKHYFISSTGLEIRENLLNNLQFQVDRETVFKSDVFSPLGYKELHNQRKVSFDFKAHFIRSDSLKIHKCSILYPKHKAIFKELIVFLFFF